MSGKIVLTPEKFHAILPILCCSETASDPAGWTAKNPLWSHCAVVSIVAQSIFGGDILRTPSLKRIIGWNHINSSHYWNRLPAQAGLPDGKIWDFTASQFGIVYPNITQIEVSSRNYILYNPKTGQPREIMQRYKFLAWRLAKLLNPGNLMLDDEIYRACFDAALDSSCQKFWVGTAVKHGGSIIYMSSNRTIGPLKSFCDPQCIRFSIQSRTESMIGACGHSEELAIWEMVRRQIPLNECEFYAAGFYPDFMPYNKKYPEFTCLRCAIQIYNAGVKTLYVPFEGRWVGLTAEECVKQAVAYATKEKAV